MFTGIVQGKAEIIAIEKKTDFVRLTVKLPDGHINNLKTGASIALNGTCLTVTSFTGALVSFDLIMETLRVTNLGELSVGDSVNFERAARFGDEIGGHILSGHIHDQVIVERIERPENNCIIWFKASAEWKRYIFAKGFIGLNGCSLTIGEIKGDSFNVFLIPETLSITTFADLTVDDKVNLEIDSHTQAVVDTVEQYLSQR